MGHAYSQHNKYSTDSEIAYMGLNWSFQIVQKFTTRPFIQNGRGKMVTTAQSPCVGQVGVGGITPPSSPSHLLYKLDATPMQPPLKHS